jgi:drug/metabolite transporter (DMT)-like permease
MNVDSVSALPAAPPAPSGRPIDAWPKGAAWAVLSVVIFAGWFVATRFTVTHSLRIWDVVALRFGVGSVLLLPVLCRPGSTLVKRDWMEGLLFSLLWGAPFVLLVALGVQLTSAAQAASVTPTLMPVFAGLIGWFALREPPGLVRLVGYASIGLGLIVLLSDQSAAGLRGSGWGIASLVLASLTWSIYTLRFRRSRLSPLESAALICVWSSLLFLPFYYLLGLSQLEHASTQELAVQAVYQGIGMSVVAVVAFNRAVASLGPRAAAAIIAFVPVTATLLAMAVLGEHPSPFGLMAIAAISLGVMLATWQPRTASPAFPTDHHTSSS